ncbi:hypothetical protein [Roseiarcus sp.]
MALATAPAVLDLAEGDAVTLGERPSLSERLLLRRRDHGVTLPSH